LKDEDGREARSFPKLVDLGVHHFGRIIKYPERNHLTDTMRIIIKFPLTVEEGGNQEVFAKVSKEELLLVMKSFK